MRSNNNKTVLITGISQLFANTDLNSKIMSNVNQQTVY